MNRAKILILFACMVCVRADELLDTAPIAEPQAKDYKFFEWRIGLGYDINFVEYSNKKINYISSSPSGAEFKLGFMLRPTRAFGIELSSGIGQNSVRFMHNGKPNYIDPLDWAYVESLFSGAKLQEIKDAMLSGDLSKVWDAFDWSKLNYDYQKTSSFDERLGSYMIPFEARLYYFINHKWATYIGGVYHKGGLIDDARAFVGLNYKLFDMKLGYVAYVSEKFHGVKNARVIRDGGVPLSLTIGAVF